MVDLDIMVLKSLVNYVRSLNIILNSCCKENDKIVNCKIFTKYFLYMHEYITKILQKCFDSMIDVFCICVCCLFFL